MEGGVPSGKVLFPVEIVLQHGSGSQLRGHPAAVGGWGKSQVLKAHWVACGKYSNEVGVM